MWQCKECEYHNDDWDESCLRCGAERVNHDVSTLVEAAPDDTLTHQKIAEEATEQDSKGTTPQPKSKKSRLSFAETFAILVIAVCVLGIVVIAYFAWSRGTLALPWGSPADVVTEDAVLPAMTEAEDQLSDELREIKQGKDRKLRSYRRFADVLETTAQQSAKISLIAMVGEEAQAKNLEALPQIGELVGTLLEEYKRFEQHAAKNSNIELLPYIKAVRAEFISSFSALFSKQGQVYIYDTDRSRTEYLLVDTVINDISQMGYADVEPLHETWRQVVHNREQRILDEQYADIYAEIGEHQAQLNAVHNEHNRRFQQIAPYNIRFGHLDVNARQYLEVLASLAAAVEEQVLEFEQYKSELAELRESDRLLQLYEEYKKLAQEDHLHCFTEVYRMYVRDKDLTHPAYASLADRYAFVEEHWPREAIVYQQIYMQCEAEWIRTQLNRRLKTSTSG
jgi:hypothetical protein